MDVSNWIKNVEDGRPRPRQKTNPQDIRDDILHPAWQCGSFPVTFQERTFLLFQWASRQLNILNFNDRGSRDDILTFAKALIEYGSDILVDTHNEMEEELEKGTMTVCHCHDPANAERYAQTSLRGRLQLFEGDRHTHCLADIVTGASHQSTSRDSMDSVDSVDSVPRAIVASTRADSVPASTPAECAWDDYSSPGQGNVALEPRATQTVVPISNFRSAATLANMAAMQRSYSAIASEERAHPSQVSEQPLFLSTSSSDDSTEEDQLCDSSDGHGSTAAPSEHSAALDLTMDPEHCRTMSLVRQLFRILYSKPRYQ
ncbi:hypothetical protein A4X13_0g8065, partial [Tilletia indica]